MVLPSISQKMKCGPETLRDLAKTKQLDNGAANMETLLPDSWAGSVSIVSHASALQSKLRSIPDL